MKRLYAVKEGGECRNEGMMIGLMVRMRTGFFKAASKFNVPARESTDV